MQKSGGERMEPGLDVLALHGCCQVRIQHRPRGLPRAKPGRQHGTTASSGSVFLKSCGSPLPFLGPGETLVRLCHPSALPSLAFPGDTLKQHGHQTPRTGRPRHGSGSLPSRVRSLWVLLVAVYPTEGKLPSSCQVLGPTPRRPLFYHVHMESAL